MSWFQLFVIPGPDGARPGNRVEAAMNATVLLFINEKLKEWPLKNNTCQSLKWVLSKEYWLISTSQEIRKRTVIVEQFIFVNKRKLCFYGKPSLSWFRGCSLQERYILSQFSWVILESPPIARITYASTYHLKPLLITFTHPREVPQEWNVNPFA